MKYTVFQKSHRFNFVNNSVRRQTDFDKIWQAKKRATIFITV